MGYSVSSLTLPPAVERTGEPILTEVPMLPIEPIVLGVSWLPMLWMLGVLDDEGHL